MPPWTGICGVHRQELPQLGTPRAEAYDIDRLDFLHLVHHQFATDRGHDADCAPMHRTGRCGSMFQVWLSSAGYRLVGKGVESLDRTRLQHENQMYDRLHAIQRKHVPVCLGSLDLMRPYHYDDGVYTSFMFFGWAWQSLLEHVDQTSKIDIIKTVAAVFETVHELHVLHRDAEPRNILFEAEDANVMLLDFEGAEFRREQPREQRTKHGAPQKWRDDDFAKELRSAVRDVSSCVVRFAEGPSSTAPMK